MIIITKIEYTEAPDNPWPLIEANWPDKEIELATDYGSTYVEATVLRVLQWLI